MVDWKALGDWFSTNAVDIDIDTNKELIEEERKLKLVQDENKVLERMIPNRKVKQIEAQYKLLK